MCFYCSLSLSLSNSPILILSFSFSFVSKKTVFYFVFIHRNQRGLSGRMCVSLPKVQTLNQHITMNSINAVGPFVCKWMLSFFRPFYLTTILIPHPHPLITHLVIRQLCFWIEPEIKTRAKWLFRAWINRVIGVRYFQWTFPVMSMTYRHCLEPVPTTTSQRIQSQMYTLNVGKLKEGEKVSLTKIPFMMNFVAAKILFQPTKWHTHKFCSLEVVWNTITDDTYLFS